MIGCLGYETILPTSVPRRSAFTLETQVLRLFTFRRFMKCSKTAPINIYGPECIMDALVTKPCFSQLGYPEIVHSSAKHKFCIFLHSVDFQNAPKTLQNIILGPMQMNGCFGYETMFGTSVPRNSAFRPETHVFAYFYTP
jgi:hypothetical protein